MSSFDIAKNLDPCNSITFADDGGKIVGTLWLEIPMKFEGKAEESAKIFFECVSGYMQPAIQAALMKKLSEACPCCGNENFSQTTSAGLYGNHAYCGECKYKWLIPGDMFKHNLKEV